MRRGERPFGLCGEHVVLADRRDHHVAHLQHPAGHRSHDDREEGRLSGRCTLSMNGQVQSGRVVERCPPVAGKMCQCSASSSTSEQREEEVRRRLQERERRQQRSNRRRAASRRGSPAASRATKLITVAVPTSPSVHGIVSPSTCYLLGVAARPTSRGCHGRGWPRYTQYWWSMLPWLPTPKSRLERREAGGCSDGELGHHRVDRVARDRARDEEVDRHRDPGSYNVEAKSASDEPHSSLSLLYRQTGRKRTCKR